MSNGARGAEAAKIGRPDAGGVKRGAARRRLLNTDCKLSKLSLPGNLCEANLSSWPRDETRHAGLSLD